MISIIVVNYNMSSDILRCLDSLAQHPPCVDHEYIVVDNCSSDPSLEILIAYLKQRTNHRMLQMKTNVGFGTACNAGAKISRGQDLCFLNPDTVVHNDFISALLTVKNDTGAAMVGPGYGPIRRLEFAAGWFPGPALESLNVLLIGRHLEAFLMAWRRRRNADRPIAVDWIVGACLVISKLRFDSIGGFDQSFFLFFEEMDLCRRIADKGEKVIFAPACRITHIGSVSGKRNYVLFTQRFYEGKIRFLAKHNHGVRRFIMLRLVWLQIWSQRALWSLPWHGQPRKASQKRLGLGLALEFLASFQPNAPSRVRK